MARVAADPAPVEGADEMGGSPDFGYFRFHGSPRIYHSDYEASRLDTIARRLAVAASDRPVWCIFDNTAASHAFGNALDLATRVGSRPR